jgi:hypothetical protein
LRTGAGASSGLLRYWGKAGTVLNDSGDAVSLRTGDETTVACVRWGSAHC